MEAWEKVMIGFGLVLMTMIVYITAETMSGLRVENIKAAMPEVADDANDLDVAEPTPMW